jgi:hypothetical protein
LGGAGGFGGISTAPGITPTPGMPAMAKPAPSRPPLDENLPPLD